MQREGGSFAVGHLRAQVVVAVEAEVGPQVRLDGVGDTRVVDDGMELRAEEGCVPLAQAKFVVGVEGREALAKGEIFVEVVDLAFIEGVCAWIPTWWLMQSRRGWRSLLGNGWGMSW